jgi:hypothetical protein
MRQLTAIAALVFSSTAMAQDAVELVVAKEVLTRLQPLSFEKRREYCGYIGYNADGIMIATKPTAGDQASCGAPFPRDMAVTASYHTHGDFDAGYFNEVPSIIDMEGDAEFYMNGYVSTPGGRMWFIDTQVLKAYQVCGIGCLPKATGFQKGKDGDIADAYEYDALREKLGN